MRARLAVLVAAPLAACGGDTALDTALDTGPDGAPFARTPVCVIVIDTLRADRFPTYADTAPPAPTLAALARGGAVFERAWSTSSWTSPAAASIFTGLLPERHGVVIGLNRYRGLKRQRGEDAEGLNRIPRGLETLPECFRGLGYTTIGVGDNPNINERMGFADGFDRFHPGRYEDAGAVVDRALEWTADLDEASQPWFLYLHFMDPHRPYNARDPWHAELAAAGPPAPYEQVARRYDSEVSYLDEQLGRLVAERALTDRALVVVTADHGEQLGERDGLGHPPTLFEELTRVPLVFHAPRAIEPGRLDAPASLADLVPTLRELVGAPPDPEADGVSLAPLLLGRPGAAESLEGRALPLHRRGNLDGEQVELHGLVDGGLKLVVQDGRESLYDLAADPGELRDVAGERPEDARRLRETLERLRARAAPFPREFAPPEEQDPDETELLERLGYADGH